MTSTPPKPPPPPPTPHQPPKKKNAVRLVVISDTHGHHNLLQLPPGDVLIHCGDFCNRGSTQDANAFMDWIFNVDGYKDKIVIDGNHDRNLKNPAALDLRVLWEEKSNRKTQQKQRQRQQIPIQNERSVERESNRETAGATHFLQDEIFQTSDGLCVYGASWQSCETKDVSELERNSDALSSPIDVLLIHSLPSSRHGAVGNAIRNHNIPLTLGGHRHWGRGVSTIDSNDRRNNIHTNRNVLVNASSLWPSSVGAVGISPPVVIDYDMETRRILYIDCEPHPQGRGRWRFDP